MTAVRRGLTVLPLVVGVVLAGAASPAAAHEPASPAVSLVVGVEPATGDLTAPVERLEDGTDVAVSGAEPVAGAHAVTVDVPAGDVAEAAAALRADPAVAYVEPDHVATTADVYVNDPYRSTQWGLDKAHVPAAWDVARGAPHVVVAVVDTGVTASSDLAGRVLPGYDFVNGDSNAADDHGHGTQVASVITGAPNNRAATAGICWYCRILPVKALSRNGSGTYSAIAKSITWAADHGADIINMSLGGDRSSRLLTDAVAYATRKGVLVVAAAGNDGSSARHYPAATDGVLSVGASTGDDRRYEWSNWGASWVDVAAPGCNRAQTRTNTVDWFCGTSSATPFVAGIAALVRSREPEPSAEQIRKLLTATAKPVPGGWVAKGRVDAAALARPAWNSDVTTGQYLSGTVALRPWYTRSLGVAKVVASLGGVAKATDTAPPWHLAVNTADVAGPAALTLTAYNAGGAPVGQALTAAVTVDNAAPTVSFRSPGATARVGRTVTVQADAADAIRVAKVQLLARGAVVATDTAAPWSLSWRSTGNGSTPLTLRAYDGAGHVAAAARTVTLDNGGPSAAIVAGPPDGRRNVRGTVRVRVTASDAAGVARVQLLVNGKEVGSATGSSATFAVDTARHGRTLKVQARAYDRVGNATTTGTRTWRR